MWKAARLQTVCHGIEGPATKSGPRCTCIFLNTCMRTKNTNFFKLHISLNEVTVLPVRKITNALSFFHVIQTMMSSPTTHKSPDLTFPPVSSTYHARTCPSTGRKTVSLSESNLEPVASFSSSLVGAYSDDVRQSTQCPQVRYYLTCKSSLSRLWRAIWIATILCQLSMATLTATRFCFSSLRRGRLLRNLAFLNYKMSSSHS
jgi:hypothetical protein